MLEGEVQAIVVNKKYILYEEIGRGKFGRVFSGLNKKTNENVAIKMENAISPIRLLKNEAKILKYLYDQGCRNIPSVLWYGIDPAVSPNYSLLVMPFYEGSLKMVSPRSLDKAMYSAIKILESIHQRYVLHRDIKPDNFMVKSGELFLIDFGMATFYIDGFSKHLIESGSRLDDEYNNPSVGSHETIVGTPNYVSYHVHCGFRGSRRDDLISLGYMYLMLHTKSLPWQNSELFVPVSDSTPTYEPIHILHPRNQARKAAKEWLRLKDICTHTNQQIFDFLNCCYAIEFDEKPDYDMLSGLFNTAVRSLETAEA
jgi:serine/threonine protein kinase